jgi:uncharacterized damage-inducible protein DinB
VDTRETLLADLDHEMAVTRRLLSRVPDDSLAWRPHEKSFSLGGLAAHLAALPHWGAQILTGRVYETSGSRPPAPTDAAPEPTLQAIIETFDRHAAEVRQVLTASPTALLDETWSLRRDGYTVLTLPKSAAVRRSLIHHAIHHRGQLTVYLRLLGVPLPPIYGASADEPL